jgi:hypothetical protein
VNLHMVAIPGRVAQLGGRCRNTSYSRAACSPLRSPARSPGDRSPRGPAAGALWPAAHHRRQRRHRDPFLRKGPQALHAPDPANQPDRGRNLREPRQPGHTRPGDLYRTDINMTSRHDSQTHNRCSHEMCPPGPNRAGTSAACPGSHPAPGGRHDGVKWARRQLRDP